MPKKQEKPTGEEVTLNTAKSISDTYTIDTVFVKTDDKHFKRKDEKY